MCIATAVVASSFVLVGRRRRCAFTVVASSFVLVGRRRRCAFTVVASSFVLVGRRRRCAFTVAASSSSSLVVVVASSPSLLRPRSSLSFVVVARFHCHSFACVVPPSRFFLLLCPRLPFISLSDMNYHHLVVVVVGGSSLPRPRPSGWRSASRCGVAFILPSVSSALRYVAFVTV
jgi:hypothetical protein